MINTSLEFKNIINGDDRRFYSGAVITLLDGTVFELDNSKIRQLRIEDATSQQGRFTLGSVIVNELTLSFNNLNDAYSDYDFTGAIIRPKVGLQLLASIETLNKGVFTADDPRVKSSVITLIALDNMMKFDKPFKGVVQVFPCSYGELLQTICTHCGVILNTITFTNSNKIIQSRPLDEAINCREVVSWVAQCSGNFARCNTSGQLELKWYDFEVFEDEQHWNGGTFDVSNPYSTGDNLDGGTFAFNDGANVDGGDFLTQNRYHHIYSMQNNPTVSTDDVVITGISVTDFTEDANTALFGQEGYIIAIEKNPLIQSLADAQMIANTVGAKIVGMRFRPMTLTSRSNPTIEAGDVGYVSTRKGLYQTLFTNVIFSVGQSMKLSCDAETPARNSSTRYTEGAKVAVEARKLVEVERTSRQQAIESLQQTLENSSGLYQTIETLPDESKIYYFHDKPIKAESQIIWKFVAEAIAISTDGGLTYPIGIEADGDAILSRLYALTVDAKLLKTGKITSSDGSTLIDMAYGVANSDNISFTDNVAQSYPLRMPFDIDDSVSRIASVKLKYTVDMFRTYSTTASSGGGSSVTSNNGGATTETSTTAGGDILPTNSSGGEQITLPGQTVSGTTGNGGSVGQFTGNSDGTVGMHAHSIVISNHNHTFSGSTGGYIFNTTNHSHSINWPSHSHSVTFDNHTHDVSIPSHTHPLNYGIMETPVTDNTIDIYIDGTKRATTTDPQGIIDLTQWITAVGWHEIELVSSTLKRISARLVIKSYIKM